MRILPVGKEILIDNLDIIECRYIESGECQAQHQHICYRICVLRLTSREYEWVKPNNCCGFCRYRDDPMVCTLAFYIYLPASNIYLEYSRIHVFSFDCENCGCEPLFKRSFPFAFVNSIAIRDDIILIQLPHELGVTLINLRSYGSVFMDLSDSSV